MKRWSVGYVLDPPGLSVIRSQILQRFPNLKQKYNGRKTYHYWHAAEKNKLADMIEMFETSGGTISVNLIRAQKTALDFAAIHNNEPMAKHYLTVGNYVRVLVPTDFRNQFPNLWELTPIGKREKASNDLLLSGAALLIEQNLITTFSENYPDLIPYLAIIPDKIAFIINVTDSFYTHANSIASVKLEQQQREYADAIQKEKESYLSQRRLRNWPTNKSSLE